MPPPPISTLFPYTTLFRSSLARRLRVAWAQPLPSLPHQLFGAADQRLVAVDGAEQLVRRSEEHTSELQSRQYLVCRLLLEKKKKTTRTKQSKQSKWTSNTL